MARFLKRLASNGHFLAIVMICLTAVITHGLFISRLGYYYDDWYMLWSAVSRGSQSLSGLFSVDRPFMGAVYVRYYQLLGKDPAGWHLVALFWRIAGGAAFYWILNLVWPKLKAYFGLAAMLFVVFPGFLAEPNAATKINQLMGYGTALFSIAFTLQAGRASSKGWKTAWLVLSVLSMAFYVWIYEYMIGLEVMRIALLFWGQWQGERQKILSAAKKVLRLYLPYILVALAFVYWRVKIFESTRPATDFKGLLTDYRTDFLGMALRLVFQVIKDFFSASTFAWFVQPYTLLKKATYGEILVALLFACGVMLLAAGYIFYVRKRSSLDAENEHPAPFVLIGIGALITLGAVFPVVLSNRYLDLMDPYKSYALHPSAGAMIMLIGAAALVKPRFRMAALVALLGLSVATQSLNIQTWANLWDVQRNYWWQLAWRAPDIQENTLVMAYLPEGYVFQQDYEIWGPVNLIYRPFPLSMPRIQAQVLNPGTVLDVLEGKFTDPYVRDIFLPRDFKNLLLISQPTTSACIHVIDGTMPVYPDTERLIVEKVGAYSKIDRIQTAGTAPVPPAAIFGQEPQHGWCYYYEQASLARQTGDWARIAELYQAAAAAGLKPSDRSEYFVFVEGLVNLGREAEAQQMAAAIKENEGLQYSLCRSLSSAPAYPDSYGYRRDQISKMICP